MAGIAVPASEGTEATATTTSGATTAKPIASVRRRRAGR